MRRAAGPGSGSYARLSDAVLQTMSAKGLLVEVCTRLADLTKLTRDEMRLAGYPDSEP
jgi:hypothetical protein